MTGRIDTVWRRWTFWAAFFALVGIEAFAQPAGPAEPAAPPQPAGPAQPAAPPEPAELSEADAHAIRVLEGQVFGRSMTVDEVDRRLKDLCDESCRAAAVEHLRTHAAGEAPPGRAGPPAPPRASASVARPSAAARGTPAGTKFSRAPMTVVLPAPPGMAPTRNDAPAPMAARQ